MAEPVPVAHEYLHSTTLLTIPRWRDLPAFLRLAPKVQALAKAAPGNLAAETKADFLHRRFWTYTIWESPESMRAFLYAGLHAEAMQLFERWGAVDAAFVHWNSALRTIGWPEGLARLESASATRRTKTAS